MGAQSFPAAEVSAALVHSLLAEQHPDLAGLALTLVANGWDNAIFRLGDDLAVRMPRRALGAALVEHEQRWLPELATRLPLPIAAPVRFGVPSADYPWRWSICAWFEGDVAADTLLADPPLEAQRLGAFVAALHLPAPADAPANPFRGQPVGDLRARVEANIERRIDVIDAPATRELLDRLVAVGEWSGPAVWLHGDLHTANVIVADGAISAVLDFGDITSGDPAVDLAIAWMLFTGEDRAVFRGAAAQRAPIDGDTWSRARAWALHFALLYLLHSADNERFGRMGSHLLAAVFDDE